MRRNPHRIIFLFALLGVSIAAFFLTQPLRRGSPVSQLVWYEQRVEDAKRKAIAHPKDPKAHLELGIAYSQGGHWLEAIEALEQALKLGMDTAEVHHHLSTAYSRLDDVGEAMKHYTRTIELEPHKLEGYLVFSEQLVKWGKQDMALRALRTACRRLGIGKRIRCVCQMQRQSVLRDRDSVSADVFQRLAIHFGQAGDLKRALEFAKHLLHLKPNHPAGHGIAGRAYLLLGDYPKAVRHLRRACQLEPQRPDTHYYLGKALLKGGSPDQEEALRQFTQTINLVPTYARAYYEMGRILRERKKWKEASLAFFTAYRYGYGLGEALRESALASQKAGDKLDAAFKMATYYQKLARFDDALHELKKLLSSNPSNSTRLEAYKAISLIYLNKRKPKWCIETLKQALKLAPRDPSIYMGLADAYKQMGKPQQRVRVLRKLCRVTPEYADMAYRELAAEAQHAGRFDEAEAYMRKCIQIRPLEPNYYYVLAQFYHSRFNLGGRLEKMIQALEKARSLAPDDFRIYYSLGIAYTKAKRLKDAAAAFRRVINLEPGYGEAYFNLSQVYRRMGQKQKARRMVQQHLRYRAWLEGLANLETKLRQHQNDYKLAFQLGVAYLRANDYVKAYQALKRAVRAKPDYLPAHEKLAEVYAALAAPSEQTRELELLRRLRAKQGTAGKTQ